jgi:hypothetical protein
MFWLGVYRDRIESYTEAIDTDDPILVNCYSTYATDTDNDGRPSTASDQYQKRHRRKTRRKQTEH